MSGLLLELLLLYNLPLVLIMEDGSEEIKLRSRSRTFLRTSSIHEAARSGDTEAIIKIETESRVKNGTLVNTLSQAKLTPLHYASKEGHLEAVKKLISTFDADVNITGKDGLTPLHSAARSFKRSSSPTQSLEPVLENDEMDGPSSDNVISFLIAHRADVNKKDKFGFTPLHDAAMRGNTFAAKELLKSADVDVNADDNQGLTPLHYAAIYDNLTIARLLVAADAKLAISDKYGRAPLHCAITKRNPKIVEFLLDEMKLKFGDAQVKIILNKPPDATNLRLFRISEISEDRSSSQPEKPCFEYPLHLAARCGDVEMIDLLVGRGAEVDCVNAANKTPLHQSAEFNQLDATKKLLQMGSSVDRKDKSGLTPFLITVQKGCEDTAGYLIKNGAIITVKDNKERNAFHLAADNNKLTIMEEMCHRLSKELNEQRLAEVLMNDTDMEGNTPLHIASKRGFSSVVLYLIDEMKCKINPRNRDELTPLHLAAKRGKLRVVAELLKRSNESLNDEDENGNTPLHLAASSGNAECIKVMLEAGASTGLRNRHQWTPLHCACDKGHLPSVKVLVDSGSPMKPIQDRETTPLHVASSKGHAEIVKYLLNRGAIVNWKDHKQRSVLDVAIQKSHGSVVMAIVTSTQWKKVISQATVRKLISEMPTAAEVVFDRCVEQENLRDDPDFKITFTYECLDGPKVQQDDNSGAAQGRRELTMDPGQNIDLEAKLLKCNPTSPGPPGPRAPGHLSPLSPPLGAPGAASDSEKQEFFKEANTRKKRHPLMLMVDLKQKRLLSHPLCVSLVQRKWAKFGRYAYYTNLFLYLIFLSFLTTYILTTEPPLTENDEDVNDNNGTTLRSQTLEAGQSLIANVGKNVIIILTVAHLIKEFFQMFQLRLNYLSFENLIEWFIYTSSLLLVIDVSNLSYVTGIRQVWQWQLGSFAILFSWLNFLVFLRKHPTLGLYVVMLTDIFKTFMEVFFVFFVLVVAFGLSFRTLFHNQEPMSTVGRSIMRTSVMMLGEMNFDDMFEKEQVLYYKASYIMFIIFLILMPVIGMNLLVGLAVDDIKSVKEEAELKRLAMQVDLVLSIENLLPRSFRNRYCRITNTYSIYPNKYNWDFDQAEEIDKFKNQPDPVQTSISKIATQIAQLETHICQLEKNVYKSEDQYDEGSSSSDDASDLDVIEQHFEDFNDGEEHTNIKL